jgi:hypothetical protein
MGVTGNITYSNELTIFVMDSLPRFIDYKPEDDLALPDSFLVKAALYKDNVPENEYAKRPYSWSRFQAGTTNPKQSVTPGTINANPRPRFLVNIAGTPDLPSQLRFKMDINTDDELEDLSASPDAERFG